LTAMKALGRGEEPTLRQIKALLAGPLKIDLASIVGSQIAEPQLSRMFPALEPLLAARQTVIAHDRELSAWAERRAEERRVMLRDGLDRAEAHTAALIVEATARMDRIEEMK